MLARQHDVEMADAIIFCRNIEPQYECLLEWALELSKPVIYELDDNLLEAPDTTPDLRYFRAPERQAQLRRYLRRADLVRVYSPALERYLAPDNSCVVRVNGHWTGAYYPAAHHRETSGGVRLVYVTSAWKTLLGRCLSTHYSAS